MPYFKIKLKQGTVVYGAKKNQRTVTIHGTKSDKGHYTGFPVDKEGNSVGSQFVKGVLHETKWIVLAPTIESVTQLWEDIRYGTLTEMSIPDQKKKYGIAEDEPVADQD